MSRFLSPLLCVFALLGSLRAEQPPDPVAQGLLLLADPRADVHEPALCALVAGAPPERIEAALKGAPTPETLDRLERARHLIRVAASFAAAPAEGATRWMWLEEALSEGGGACAHAMLRRAGQPPLAAQRLLAEREAARGATQEYLAAAYENAFSPGPVVATAARRGASLVPHLLRLLASGPWREWPPGLRVMNQRFACWLLQALKPLEAVPYLLLHVSAPSATLQFDVLETLRALTGDPAWAMESRGGSAFDAAVAHVVPFWKRNGAALAGPARWMALDSLRHERDYLVSRAADPGHRENMFVEGAPDPHEWLYDFLARLGIYQRPSRAGLPPAEATAPAARLQELARAWHDLRG